MKRAVSIQDLSCMGKCSLTVALPILSAMGVETAVVPTALLSTHTAFRGFHFHDLSDHIAPIAQHWKEEGFTFDCISTGYLGTTDEVDIVRSFVSSFRTPSTLFVADPAMADWGKMYAGLPDDFPMHMRRLLENADIILPNMTEAYFLLGKEYEEREYGKDDMVPILEGLSAISGGKVLLKGVHLNSGKIANVWYDRENGETFWHETRIIPVSFSGTGDVFASAFTGAYLKGFTGPEAMVIAADYVLVSIEETIKEENYHTWGIDFEKTLPYLMKRTGVI